MIDSNLTSPGDALSQLLDEFRLHGSVSARVAARAPWGYSLAANRDLGLLVVLRGRLRFEREGAEPGVLELATGDVVATPSGDAYALRDAPDSPLIPIEELGACPNDRVEVPGAQTEFLLLRCELTGGCTNPVRAALPRLIHCAGSDGRAARWLEPTIRLLALESSAPSIGRTTVLNRLAEVIFVHLIRAWLDRQSPDCGGWLRAVTDPQLSQALSAFHAEPGRPWTLPALAERAGMSRSAFAARFKALASQTPLEYMTGWRMDQARSLIEAGRLPLKQVVTSLGYTSEAAFRTAFKRRVGQTPGEYRTMARRAAATIAG